MDFSVIKSGQAMVHPCELTPSGTLDLSIIDNLPALRCKVRTIHVFKYGPNAATVIRNALSEALVHYYPLAGRLVESDIGVVRVDCTSGGVWFVEASANCSLEAINYLDKDFSDLRFELLPHSPQDGLDPLVLMQVTQFACDGFVIGLEFSHCICDGMGAAQFLKAVSEFARGLQVPSISPVWGREALTAPSKLAHRTLETIGPIQPPPMPDYRLEQVNMDISLEHIANLRSEFYSLTGKTCSTFEALAASVWRHRTRAIGPKADTDVTLVFFANARPLMDPPVAEGFYGNCFFPVVITVPSERLKWATHAETVKLIQEAKALLPAQFSKWMAGENMDNGMDPFAPPLSYNTLFVSEWARLGFGDVDYGWGPPVHFVPVNYSNIIPVCIMGSPPRPQKGVQLMTWCVEEAHLKFFHDQLMNRS